MMSTFGFLEFIALLTTLGSFGVDANPRAPSAAEVMTYAPADADFMIHADLQAVVPGNYKRLQALSGEKVVKVNPQLRGAVDAILQEIRTSASTVKGLTGLDPVADVHSVTSWIQISDAGQPQLLLVLRGNLAADVVDRIAQTSGGTTTAIDGHKVFMAPDGSFMLALKKGQLLLGTAAWVQSRLAASWKASRPDARVTAVLDARPFFAMVSRPSQAAGQRIANEIGGGDNVALDLIRGHEIAALALTHQGVTWTVTSREARGYERAVMASEGILDLMRASHHGVRGLAKVMMAGLPSYAGQEPEIDAILRHQDELLKVVDSVTGDGKFKVDFKKQPRQRTLTVKATGKKLSDVISVVGLLPVMGAGMYLGMSRAADEQEMAATAKVVEVPEMAEDTAGGAAGRLDVRSVYRQVKRAHGM
jgi:hypothetical protein